jgi:hypothetical protein
VRQLTNNLGRRQAHVVELEEEGDPAEGVEERGSPRQRAERARDSANNARVVLRVARSAPPVRQ